MLPTTRSSWCFRGQAEHQLTQLVTSHFSATDGLVFQLNNPHLTNHKEGPAREPLHKPIRGAAWGKRQA